MKRVYQEVTVGTAEAGFRVLLDGRPVLTPARVPLVLPTEGLALAVAEEWRSQGKAIKPATMPLMALACTSLDLTNKQRGAVVDQIVAYAGTDLVCYRVDHPADLVARENQIWQPLLDWLAERYGVTLNSFDGLMPQPQPEATILALRAAIEALDIWMLTALQEATTSSGSLVIGLAMIERRLDPEQAFDASQLHESYQIEFWGEDYEATKRRAALRADIAATCRFIALL